MLGGRDLEVLRPRDSEALIDEHAFEHEEFLPYWAELWPSGLALARRVAVRALHGARTLELGCGLALPSLAAALAGGRAWRPTGRRRRSSCVRENAARNGIALEAERADWAAPDALVERAPWDLVLGADLLYERRNAELLLPLLPRLLGPASELWLADPGRPPAGPFLEAAAADVRGRLERGSAAAAGRRPPAAQERCLTPFLRQAGRGDLQRAGGDAAGAADAVRDAAVEQQRVALLERVDLAVEVDLEAAARDVEQHLARRDLALARASGGCRRSTRARSSARRRACGRRRARTRRSGSRARRSRCARARRARRAPERSTAGRRARRARGRSARPSRRSAARARARAGSGRGARARPPGRAP